MTSSVSAGENDVALAVTVRVRDKSQVIDLLNDTASFLSGTGQEMLTGPGDSEIMLRRVDRGDFVIVRIKT